MDLPGSKIPVQEVTCPLAMQLGAHSQPADHGDDDYDLLEIAKLVFKKRNLILAVTLIAAIAGVVYAKSIPNIYRSEVLVIPNQRFSNNSGGGGAASLGSQFGGLASVMGISLGGGGAGPNESDVYLAIMRTRPFAEYTIKEFNLLPLLAAEGTKQPEALKLDDAASALLGGMKIVNAGKDVASGTRISFSGRSPERSAKIAETLVKSINRYSQYDTIVRAKKDIERANAQIQQSPLTMVQKTLWDIVSRKTVDIILAEAMDDFTFRTIEPAVIPKGKISPQRGTIVIGFTAVGFLIGIVAALILSWPLLQRKST